MKNAVKELILKIWKFLYYLLKYSFKPCLLNIIYNYIFNFFNISTLVLILQSNI